MTTDDPGRPLLEAMAVERSLTRPALIRLGEALAKDGVPVPAVEPWVDGALRDGRVVEGPPHPRMPTGPDGRQPRLSLAPGLAAALLRRLASEGRLRGVAAMTTATLKERSLAAGTVALMAGDLPAFDRAAKARPWLDAAENAAWLRAIVADAFDGDWATATFGASTPRALKRLLVEALPGPHDVAALATWTATYHRTGLERELAEHAFLQGDADRLGDLATHLDPTDASLFRAAEALLRGDVDGARGGARAALDRRRPDHQSVLSAPLAVLVLGGDDEDRAKTAGRLFPKARRPGEKGAGKAFRGLVKHLDRAEKAPRRLDVYQLAADASAWEVLLTALTVRLHFDAPVTRTSWAVHLTRRGGDWIHAGYRWLGRMALKLAAELDMAAARDALGTAGEDPAQLDRAARAPGFWDELRPKPAWRQTLESLAVLSRELLPDGTTPYRVVWFVDMVHLGVNRPALERHDRESGGWVADRRLAFSELMPRADDLPPEDTAVLNRLRLSEAGHVVNELEVLEALIGHPRVLGTSGERVPIAIVRGHCRIDTRDEVDAIAVDVEPRDASPGLHAVVRDPRTVAVYRVDEGVHRVLSLFSSTLRVPREHEAELVAALSKVAGTVAVQGPHLGAERTVLADATPCLRLAAQAGGFLVYLGVRPFGAEGRFFPAGEGPRTVSTEREGQRLRCERDQEAERERVAALVAACPTLQLPEDDEEETEWFFTEGDVLTLLAELRDAGQPCELEWRGSPGLRLTGSIRRGSLKGALRQVKGWYLLDATVRLDANTDELVGRILRGTPVARGRFVRIAPGEYAEVEASLRRSLSALHLSAGGRGDEVRLPPSATTAMEALAALGDGITLDAAAQAWLERVRAARHADVGLPADFKATLRDYQHEGYRWLRNLTDLGLGACLADDMGLGKTVQVIALIAAAARGPCIVVAPTSVCTNWIQEFARFAPTVDVVDYYGPDRARHLDPIRGADGSARVRVVVTSYALLQQDEAQLADIGWDLAVLDEAQLIKNPTSLRARAAYALTARARVVATGTPVENNLGDLWAIFRFLNPALLGDYKAFRRRFALPIEREGSDTAREALRAAVRGYVLRRTKGEVLKELPPVTEVSQEVPFNDREQVLYDLLQKQIHDKLKGSNTQGDRRFAILAELTRLRRFCCHPTLVFPDAEVESSKVEAFLRLADELRESGHRALVFSQFVDFLDIVRERLHERGLRYEYLDGSTPRKARQERVDAFQKGDASLFLISLKAGGFGLNLTGADYVIHLDPWWNPAVERQATDRAHRIGQDRPVTVYRLLAARSIEGKIVQLQQHKHELADALLEGTELAAKLTTDDLMGLLGIA